MPGTVTRILAEPGVGLQRGAPLLVLEAMKMEHTLRAPASKLDHDFAAGSLGPPEVGLATWRRGKKNTDQLGEAHSPEVKRQYQGV
jgi:Biotin-requiring enzyme